MQTTSANYLPLAGTENILPRKELAHPLAFLIFTFLYYFLAASMRAAVSGISMAAVEGVASYPSWFERFNALTPVFVYLGAWMVHSVWEYRKLDTRSVRLATARTFQVHLAWFAIGVGVWICRGTPALVAFEIDPVGKILYGIGNYLPGMLIAVFIWTLVTNGQNKENGNTEPLAAR